MFPVYYLCLNTLKLIIAKSCKHEVNQKRVGQDSKKYKLKWNQKYRNQKQVWASHTESMTVLETWSQDLLPKHGGLKQRSKKYPEDLEGSCPKFESLRIGSAHVVDHYPGWGSSNDGSLLLRKAVVCWRIMRKDSVAYLSTNVSYCQVFVSLVPLVVSYLV